MYRKGFLEIHSLLKRDSINISPNQQELIKLINIIELVVVGIRRHRFLLLCSYILLKLSCCQCHSPDSLLITVLQELINVIIFHPDPPDGLAADSEAVLHILLQQPSVLPVFHQIKVHAFHPPGRIHPFSLKGKAFQIPHIGIPVCLWGIQKQKFSGSANDLHIHVRFGIPPP